MQMAQEAGNGFIRLRLRLIHLHGKSRTPEGPHGKESGHDGLDRSGLRERLLLLGFNLYGDSDWRGGDAGTLAGWYTIPDCRLSSAGLVPLAWLASHVACEEHAATGADRTASAGRRQCGPGVRGAHRS